MVTAQYGYNSQISRASAITEYFTEHTQEQTLPKPISADLKTCCMVAFQLLSR